MSKWLIALLTPLWCFGAVTAIHVVDRSDVLDGASFGAAGPYERIVATAHFAVDPKLPANRIIADIDLAPRNEKGMVEFSADLYVLKPRDPARSNGTVLFEVSNRGGKGMLSMFNRAVSSADPREPAHFGDGFLLRQGYTLVWLGWQFDVPREPGRMRLYAPAAPGITGVVRTSIVLDKPETVVSLADRNHIPYPVADARSATLTVRERVDSKPTPIDRSRWRFPDAGHIALDGGFQPGKIYEVVYLSKDPTLVGLGPAAVRDFISFLKYGGVNTLLGDQARYVKRALGYGVSQSGRFLRTFLYYGFNADEKGRKVFDGVWAHVAGAGRGSFNHRFAQPSRDGHPHLNILYPTDIFPFTDLEQTDPETGMKGGILVAAQRAGVIPKVFYTNGSYEYWGRSAALTHVTVDGAADALLPESTRIYFFTGTQHGPGAFPPRRGNARYLSNPHDYRPFMRALLMAMQAWLQEGKEPPPSRYPMIGRRELVTLSQLRFPPVPGVAVPARPQRAWRADYGPEFYSKGVVAYEPPKLGKPFPVLVPQVDADGNEIAGIRSPEIVVPLATYTGWNLRTPEIGAPDEMYSMVGSWFPFAATRKDRERTSDPRPSIEERYSSREEYLGKVREATAALVGDGYLLQEDASALIAHCTAVWDYLQRVR
jgi:hypothetical protein